MKRVLKLKVSLVVLAFVGFGSSFGALTYAESLKDEALVESVVHEQVSLGKSLKGMYDSVNYNNEMIKDAELLLNDHQSTLRVLQMDIAEIKNLTNDTVISDYQALENGIRVVSNRLAVFKLYNSLFDSSIFNDEGLDTTVVVKDAILIKDIDTVRKKIDENPQSDKLAPLTEEVLAFALDQVNDKKVVDEWLSKHGSDFTVVRQNELKELVESISSDQIKTDYSKTYGDFKSKVDAKLEKEKKDKVKQEQKKKEQDRESAVVQKKKVIQQDVSDNSGNSNVIQKEPDNNIVVEPTPAPVPTPVVPERRVDGFNFGNYHFDVQSFSGLGAVPQWTPYVYRWTTHPSHYLFERSSDAGSAVWNIGVGDTVTVDGSTFTVYKVLNNVVNDDNAYGVLLGEGASISWQTCEENTSTSDLTIWLAR